MAGVCMKTFLGISSMTALVALSLTPEMSTGLAILVAAFFSGMTAMLTALYTARTQRIVATREMAKVIGPVEAKIDKIIPVVEKIDGHVNSEKTKAEGEIAAKEMEIALQREMIVELKAAAALLAQARATSDISSAIVAAAGVATIPAAPAAPILASIDTNTRDTAKNTAKTDATVQALKDQA